MHDEKKSKSPSNHEISDKKTAIMACTISALCAKIAK
jgi:hypothetical protein